MSRFRSLFLERAVRSVVGLAHGLDSMTTLGDVSSLTASVVKFMDLIQRAPGHRTHFGIFERSVIIRAVAKCRSLAHRLLNQDSERTIRRCAATLAQRSRRACEPLHRQLQKSDIL